MINKASELLEIFINEENKKLQGIKMPHMPTLGSAYEEITKQGIDQEFVIPKNLDLRVVSGFISIDGVTLPEQIDCMLVHGDGEKYGLTGQYIYDIKKILCIFEVKKTLTKSQYVDAIDHLAKIRWSFSEHFENRLIHEGYEPDICMAKRNYSRITGKVGPENYYGIHGLAENDGILFYTLVQESLAPVSIVHSYDGYKTESGLRKAFCDILEDKIKVTGAGIGIPSIPSLVTSNQHCIVKGNGLPYLIMTDDNEWVALFSIRHNPARVILELIWTKISTFFGIEMPWDDDLYMDNVKPLLTAKVISAEGRVGWMYNTHELTEKKLNRNDTKTWKPISVGAAEISAIMLMAANGGYLATDENMSNYFFDRHSITIEKLKRKLINTRLFMEDQDFIRPINQDTYLLSQDDKTGYISSDRVRFDLWCKENKLSPNYFIILFLE